MLRTIPSAEFVKQIAEISAACRNSDDPIILTQPEHGDLVVMGIEAHKKMLAMMRLLRDIAEANAEFIENAIPDEEELIDQAVEIAHEQIQSRFRLSNAA